MILTITKIVKTVNCCSFDFFSSSLFIVTKCTMEFFFLFEFVLAVR